MGDGKLKVVVGCISHETNTFSNVKTDLRKFKDNLWIGEEIIKAFAGKRTIGSAFIDVAREEGVELIPTIWAEAYPQGLVTEEAFDYLLNRLLEGIESNEEIDGVLLELHGAMVTEKFDDAEGEILQAIRKTVGKDKPIVSTLDLHANISQKMVDNADALIGYDTYPHIDRYERGLEAARVLLKVIKGEYSPVAALEKPQMMPSPQKQKTEYYPMKALIEKAHEIEKDGNVINVTVAGGYPYADVEDAGMSFLVTTNGDRELAEEKAEELARMAWKMRREFLADVVPVREAIEEALKVKEGPVVLADISDNPGGGAPCDGTVLLREMLALGVENAVLALIADGEAVREAIEAGVGNSVTLKIGGKTDRLHGEPLEVTGEVKTISDGKFLSTGPMGTWTEVNLGRTVVLRCGGVDVILTEKRYQPTTLQLYRSLGIEPSEKKVIVVKSSVHFRASHEPIAKKIIEVDTPGIHSPRLSAFNYKKIRRPIFPLDTEMLGITELKRSLFD